MYTEHTSECHRQWLHSSVSWFFSAGGSPSWKGLFKSRIVFLSTTLANTRRDSANWIIQHTSFCPHWDRFNVNRSSIDLRVCHMILSFKPVAAYTDSSVVSYFAVILKWVPLVTRMQSLILRSTALVEWKEIMLSFVPKSGCCWLRGSWFHILGQVRRQNAECQLLLRSFS